MEMPRAYDADVQRLSRWRGALGSVRLLKDHRAHTGRAHQECAAIAAMADNRWHQAPPARLVLWWHSGTPTVRCRQAEWLNW